MKQVMISVIVSLVVSAGLIILDNYTSILPGPKA